MRMPHGHICSVAIRALFKSQIINLKIEMSYSVDQINNNPWLGVQDVVGDAKTWPKFIRNMFWDRNFNDHHRMILVNFVYLNHISEDFLHEILAFILQNAYTDER